MMKKQTPEQLMFMKNSKAKQKTTTASMKGQTAVVSGSTSGVGLNTIEHLAKAGANIVMVCRNMQKAVPFKERLEK
jgi:NADP-dependent 3-hydroxy acid dehydrogenase YdfG